MGTRSIEDRLDSIERYARLSAKNVLTLEEAALTLGMKPATVYRLTMTRKLPYYKPNGKMLYFKREDLEDYMLTNRHKSDGEIESEAATQAALKRLKHTNTNTTHERQKTN